MAAADQEPHHAVVHPRSYQDESYLRGFLGTVGDLQKAGVLQDVVLEVGDRLFPCHRLVLSAASPYFRAMFTSDMAESRKETVVLKGLDASMLEDILSYIYSGTLQLSLDKVQPLYQAADLLQLDYVRDTCSSYMAMNVEHSTCVDLYKFADVFSLDMVKKCCLKLICKHFAKVIASDEFCSLSVNQLTEIISHDELDVKEETTVWEAVVRWVQHSREDRLHHLPRILPHIRFNLLTSDDMAAILEHPLVREDPGRSEVIRDVQKENPDLKPRLGMTTEMVLVYNTEAEELLFMNPREGKYVGCYCDPNIIAHATSVTVTRDNNIYIVASEPEGADPLSLFEYSHAENVWERVGVSSPSASLELATDGERFQQLSMEVDQVLYHLVVEWRGVRRRTVLCMAKYDRHTDQWQTCSRLKLNKKYVLMVALSCGPNLYFLSGSEVHRYDPSQDRWSERTPPKLIPDICTAVAMGTEIFCTDKEFSKTMVYNTESDRWQKLSGWPNPEILPRHLAAIPRLFALENQLHVSLAAFDIYLKPSEYMVYVYDRSADDWRDLEVTLPDKTSVGCGFPCHVARMYLPFLKGAQKHIIEVL